MRFAERDPRVLNDIAQRAQPDSGPEECLLSRPNPLPSYAYSVSQHAVRRVTARAAADVRLPQGSRPSSRRLAIAPGAAGEGGKQT